MALCNDKNGGKGKLRMDLENLHGYSQARSRKIVNAVIAIIKKAVQDGKTVELEGIGTLYIGPSNSNRERIQLHNGFGGPSIRTMYKQRKTVRFKPAKSLVKKVQEVQ